MLMMMTIMMMMAGSPFITQLILSLSLFKEPLSQEPGANFEHTPRSPPNISVNHGHLAMYRVFFGCDFHPSHTQKHTLTGHVRISLDSPCKKTWVVQKKGARKAACRKKKGLERDQNHGHWHRGENDDLNVNNS
jgi:hypothetical protein